MKPRIQVTLAALLLVALAAGCTPGPSRCSPESGEHSWSKWEVYGTAPAGPNWVWHERRCETCGWTERRLEQ